MKQRQKMGPLARQRCAFSKEVSILLLEMNERGYQAAYNDIMRDKRCPYGSRSSRHHMGLAADILLYKDGYYLEDTEDHAEFGERWEKINGIWGGRWQDGNHYEFRLPKEWERRK